MNTLTMSMETATSTTNRRRDCFTSWRDGSKASGPDAKVIDLVMEKIARQWHEPTKASENGAEQALAAALQALRAQPATTQAPKMADRLEALSQDAEEEGEAIRAASLMQFRSFFEGHPGLGLPKITLTPDGTLRTRWLDAQGHFFAIEFTGRAMAKIVAEVPRPHGQRATHYATEPLNRITTFAETIGASLA